MFFELYFLWCFKVLIRIFKWNINGIKQIIKKFGNMLFLVFNIMDDFIYYEFISVRKYIF